MNRNKELVHHVLSIDRHNLHHLETCQKCKLSGLTQDIWNWKLQGQGQQSMLYPDLLGGSNGAVSLKNTGLVGTKPTT